MNSGNSISAPIVLNSWKEIANYVGRGVRTVQRWEADLGMPVRRPRAKSRSAVLAMSDEIDAWLRSAPTGELKDQAPRDLNSLLQFRSAVAQHNTLRDRCHQLRTENQQSLSTLVSNLRTLMTSMEINRETRTPQQTAYDSDVPSPAPVETIRLSFND